MFCGELGVFLKKWVVVMDLYERLSKDEFIKWFKVSVCIFVRGKSVREVYLFGKWKGKFIVRG